MIYVAALVLIVTVIRYTAAVRDQRSYAPLREIAWAILGGLAGGVLLAIAARAGMAAITIANGAEPNLTWSGTSRVLLTFTGIGGATAIAYAGLFGRAMSRRGLIFGILLVVATAWPLAQAAAPVLAQPLPRATMISATALVLSLMWIPYALVVERVVAALNRG